MYQAKHSTVKLSRAKFYEILPWELKEAYRETCLCSSCENLMLYMQALKVAAEVLQPLVLCDECEDDDVLGPGNELDSEADDHDDEPTSKNQATACEPPDPKLKALLNIISSPLKSQLVSALVCGGKLEAAKKTCVDGDCAECGLKRWWSGPKGYRREVVEYSGPNKGQPKPGLPAAWHCASCLPAPSLLLLLTAGLRYAPQTACDGSALPRVLGRRSRWMAAKRHRREPRSRYARPCVALWWRCLTSSKTGSPKKP